MKQKELTQTFMMISNWKKLGLHRLHKNISALSGMICTVRRRVLITHPFVKWQIHLWAPRVVYQSNHEDRDRQWDWTDSLWRRLIVVKVTTKEFDFSDFPGDFQRRYVSDNTHCNYYVFIFNANIPNQILTYVFTLLFTLLLRNYCSIFHSFRIELLAQFIGLNYENQFKFKLLNSISIDLPI